MKNIVTLLFVFCVGTGQAQNMLNPSFDSIYIGAIDRVLQWVTSDATLLTGNGDTVLPLNPNQFYDASGLQFSEIFYVGQQSDTSSHSAYALKLKSQNGYVKTDGSHYESYVYNGTHFYTDAQGYIDFSRGGIPFPYQPTKLKGLYQFVDSTLIGMNFGKCKVLLKKWNATKQQSDTIAYLESTTDFSPTNGWQNFEIPIPYFSTQLPDSLVVVFFANTRPDQKSTFWLDEVHFDYTGFGMADWTLNPNFVVYPNPSNALLHFKISNANFKQVKIYNATTACVLESAFINPLQIEHLEAGVYFIELKDNDGNVSTAKFVKQ